MPELIIALVIVAALIGVVLFARRKIHDPANGGDDATGGGGRPGADKH